MRIDRPAIDATYLSQQLELLEKLLPVDVAGARKNSRMLNPLQLTAMDYAACLMASGAEQGKIVEALRFRLQAIVAIFLGSVSDTATIAYRLGDEETAPLRAAGLESFAHTGSWIDGYFLAALLRDVGGLNALCNVPIELIRNSSTKTDEYGYLLAETLRGFWLGAAETPALLEAALEATESGSASLVDEEIILNVDVPKIELLFLLMAEDGDGFNVALTSALRHHKKFWSKGKRKSDTRGFFPVVLSGLAAFAHDRGIQLDVESDYLPYELIRLQ